MSHDEHLRLLGIDYGTVRIGLAISDEGREFAFPLDVLKVTGAKDALRKVTDVCGEREIAEIVIGLPLNMDGSPSEMSESAEAFAESLKKRTGCVVHVWDERLTSVAAEREMIRADVSRGKRKEMIDKLAAQSMLQSYLDAQRWRTNPDMMHDALPPDDLP